MKKTLVILILFCFLLPNFSFAQSGEEITPPENIEEMKEIGEKALTVGEKEFPGIIQKIWKEEVLPLWQKMWNWFKKNIWDSYFAPFFKKEIEKRKPIIEEEFQKEKKEMKESAKTEVPQITKSLWEKFKELIK